MNRCMSRSLDLYRRPGFQVVRGIAVMLLLIGLGCQAEAVKTPPAASSPSADSQAAEPESAATAATQSPGEITLVVVDQAGYRKALDSKRGQLVLVDAWATWCGPCKKAFPHTVALHEKYGPQGLAVVSLSMDDDDAHEQALQFLTEQKANFTNLRSKLGAEEAAVEQFEIDGGALPHLKLYDRDGKLVKKFITGDPDSVFTPEDVDLAIRELIVGGSAKE